MKKVALKTFLNIHRNVAALQFYLKKTPTQMFSSEYYEFLRTPILKKKLLMSAWFCKTSSEQRWAVTSVLTLFLSSDKLLTGYEQLSY